MFSLHALGHFIIFFIQRVHKLEVSLTSFTSFFKSLYKLSNNLFSHFFVIYCSFYGILVPFYLIKFTCDLGEIFLSFGPLLLLSPWPIFNLIVGTYIYSFPSLAFTSSITICIALPGSLSYILVTS